LNKCLFRAHKVLRKKKNLLVFWPKASLIYLDFEVNFVQTHPNRNPFIDPRLYNSNEENLVTYNESSIKVFEHEDIRMTIEQDYSQGFS